MKKNRRRTKNYFEATFQILGFFPDGKIFYGKNLDSIFRSLKEMKCQFGLNGVMFAGFNAKFIEDCLQLMNKDEHIVFKCPYDTLGEDLAK